jgi:lysophospholipase L1-like esterase
VPHARVPYDQAQDAQADARAPAGPGPRWRLPPNLRPLLRWPAELMGLVLVGVAAIALAIAVTPMQQVMVAGQAINVGATSPDLSFSGPGEIDLFGQSLPTTQQFAGPVRPRLELAHISINGELTNLVQGAGPRDGHSAARPDGVRARDVAATLGGQLAAGWQRYFVWEIVVTAAGALLILGALAGWRRLPRRATIKLLAAGLVAAEALNLGAIMIAAYSAPAALRQTRSLNQLVGSENQIPPVAPKGPALHGVRVVVLGDSTASGAGLATVAGATRTDRDCGRSSDSYPLDLANANGWDVLNLACNSATIRHGVLGQQRHGGQKLPPQLSIAEQASGARVVIVSVGSDDLGWSAMLQYCATAPACSDKATTAYFQQQLASFSTDYLQLLSRLASLPGHPRVIVNQYYNPFGSQSGCLSQAGLTYAKLDTLTSRLASLNAVLAKGAAQFGFSSPQPEFAGHELCTSQPYVQGLDSAAPFHPTDMGQLAIALADQAALQTASAQAPGASPTPTGLAERTPPPAASR